MPGRLAAARASREASERSAHLLPRRTASTQGGLAADLEDASLDGESNAISCASGRRLLHNTCPEASVGQGFSVRNPQQQQQQQLHDLPTSSQSVTFLVSSGQHGQNGTPTAAAALSHHAGAGGGSEPGSPARPPRTPSTAIPPLPSAGTLVVQTSGGSDHTSASIAAANATADPARGQWQGISSSSFHNRSNIEWTAAGEPESPRAEPAIGSGPVAAAPAFAFAAAVNANTSIPSTASGAGITAGISGAAATATGGMPSTPVYHSSIQQPVGTASAQVWRAAVTPVERSRPSLVTAIPVRHSRLRIAATASELSGANCSGTLGDGAGATSVAAGMGSATMGGSSPHHSGSQQQSAMQMLEAGSAAGTPASEGIAPSIRDLPASLGNPPSEAMAAWTATATRAFSGGGSSSTCGTPAGTVGGTGSFVSRGRGARHRLTPAGSVGFGGVSELFADGGRGEEAPSGESSFTVRQTPSDMEDELLERARARRAIRSITLANVALELRSPDGSASVGGSTAVRRPGMAIAGCAAAEMSALTAGTYGHAVRAGTTGAVIGTATMPADASGAPNGASRVAIRLNHQPGHQRRPPNRHASMPAMKRDGANSAGVNTDGTDGGRCGGGGPRRSPLTRPPLSGGLLPEDAVPEDIEGEDMTSLQYSALAGGGGGPGGGGDLPSGYSRMPSDSPITSQMSLTSSVVCQGASSTTQQRQLSVTSLQQTITGGGIGAAAGAATISSSGVGTGSGSTGTNAIAASLALAPAQPPQPLSRLAAPGFPPAGVPPALLVRLPDLADGSSGQRPSFEEEITRPTPAVLVGSSAIPGVVTPAPNSSCVGYVGAAADRPSQRCSRMLSGTHAQTHSSSLAALHKAVEKLMLQDSGLYAKVQASMKGISSLAKETNKLEFVRDASGATVINQYVVVKTLGRGAFGKVKLCLNTLDGQLYAVKMINRAHLLRQLQKPARPLRRRAPPPRNTSDTGLMDMHHRAQASDGNLSISHTNLNSNFGNAAQVAAPARASMDDTSPLAAIMREIAVMKKVDHPHVVRLHEVIDPPGSSYLMMVMEYCEGGCVMETRAQTGLTPLGEDTAREYFRQACLGLDYLHYNNVIHGDLKPENMLVSGTGVLKIADFGSSRFMGGDPTDATKTSCTPAFQSPEEIGHMPVDPFAADLWALACCLFCFVFGRLPFVGSCVVDIYRAILTRPHVFPEEAPCSPALKDLLNRMLDKDPNKRLKLRELGQHEWVTAGDLLPPLQFLQSQGSAGSGGEAPPPVIHVTHAEQVNAIDRSSLVSLVRARLKEKACQPGEYLFKEGEEAHCVYMIMAGVVELTQHLRRPGGTACHGGSHGHGGATATHAVLPPGGGAAVAHSHGGGGGGPSTTDGGVASGGELPGGDHDASFSVDLDESLTLDHPDMGQITEAMNIVDGKLHIDRQQAIEIRRRMQGSLLGDNAEYVVEVKGPGSVIGEIGMDNAAAAKHRVSARARGPVTVVKLTEENFFKALLQMYGEGGGGGGSAASTTLTASSASEAVGKGGGGAGVANGGAGCAPGGGGGGTPGLSAQHLMVMQYLEDSGSYACFPPASASGAGATPGRFSLDYGAGPSTLGSRHNHPYSHHHNHHHHHYNYQNSGGSPHKLHRNHSAFGGSANAAAGEHDRSPSPQPWTHTAKPAAALQEPASSSLATSAGGTGAVNAASNSISPAQGSNAALPTRRSGAFHAAVVPARALGLVGAVAGGGSRVPEVHPMLGMLNTIYSVNASRGGAATSEEGIADL
ncbi:hypothetical protein VaNZ11_000756 [Volvox africanus]|uniref:cGMP-dependent protein kinase n=1 Tax=Volvox africanus TaxID=51714 RepID=A0ABQ5RNU0_9CHLO|nr:hypothetical protein VaNZ11_000756 [Volvox africanus]